LKISYGLNEVDLVANQLINNVETKILLFYGDMGVGKTTLIKAIVKALGSNDEVSSPTFSIVNEYELENDKIFHFDLYRIKDLDEAYNFGIEDYIYSDNWILVEWPEKIEPILIDNYNQIELKTESENQRNLNIVNR
jgi:tRNA threonylcarbamoyladenosine biosynthesis protein TsaE